MNLDVQFVENNQQIGVTFTDVTTLEGATFIPAVSDDGFISWSNDQDLPNPEPVNIKGERGEKGEQGDAGISPVVEVSAFDGYSLLSVTDVNGTREYSIPHGKDGEDGSAPEMFSEVIEGGHRVVFCVPSAGTRESIEVLDGNTPARGVDYWTETDRAEIVEEVLAALPAWTGGSY